MPNNNSTISTTSLYYDRLQENRCVGQNIEPVEVLFNFLFNNNVSLKDRNKFLLLFLQEYISKGNFQVVKKVMSEVNTFYDIHVSFLKAMLMITENIDSLSETRERVSKIYIERMGNI